MYQKIPLLYLLFNSIFLFAQDTQRLEVPYDKDYEDMSLYALKNKTIVIKSEADKTKKGQRNNRFAFYNANFELLKKENILVPKELNHFKDHYTDNTIYSLFSNREVFQLLILDTSSNKISSLSGDILRKTTLKDMAIEGDNIAFVSSSDSFKHSVTFLNTKTKESKTLECKPTKKYDRKSRLENVNIVHNKVVLTYTVKTRKEQFLIFSHYDLTGNYLYEDEFKVDNTYPINSLEVVFKDEEYLISGSFSKTLGKNNIGIFMGKVKKGGELKLNLYPYFNMDSYTAYYSKDKLNKSRKKKITRSKEVLNKRFEKGKNTLVFKFKASEVPLRILENGNLLLQSELYQPYYVSTSDLTTGMSSTRLAGYEYLFSLVVLLDSEGNKIWDNLFKLGIIKKTTEEKIVEVNYNSEITNLKFLSYNDLFSQNINSKTGEVLKFNSPTKKDKNHQTSTFVENLVHNDQDNTKRISYSELKYWYPNTFVNYGLLKIKKSKNTKKKKVFFIEKINTTNNE